ncbi:dynein regulatory complex subunit 3 [Selaginella moellendorffii]|uniref:dynein regulatory complex subunit 3 n=1 Tax=Selaginella moellendorffii TaxID=88036 RepID=UPI000D1C8D7F|nr:dynein regulatory complex subunit 3 [Selaginella moellendorffii]|eukprot:XP_024542302.1 dynein regulatory complex subunit 3 [Selaginella moellendorffii]
MQGDWPFALAWDEAYCVLFDTQVIIHCHHALVAHENLMTTVSDECMSSNTGSSRDFLKKRILAGHKMVEGGSPEKLEERKRTMPLSQRSINWLHGLGSLTKLYLDNNDISKIENLSHLATLKLLDLSFNKIKSIGGLETLTNLEDLSLYHNEIEKITGLDTLQKITSFSLGKNRIRRLEDVIPLRRLRNLHVLTLDGNPLATDPEYRIYVISHLRDLTYFDHRYVDRAAVVAARDQYQDDMTDLKQKEAEEDLLIKAAEEHATRQALYKDANLLGCDTLFERMISEDVEYPKLSQVPGLLASMDEYFRLVSPHVDFDILAEVRLNSSTADKNLALLREDNDRTREKLLELEMLTFGEVHLLRDKDMILNAIQASHDARTLKIDSLIAQAAAAAQAREEDLATGAGLIILLAVERGVTASGHAA